MSLSGSLNVVLPLQATLGSQLTSGTLTISDADLSGGAAPSVQFQGFAGWQNFTTVGPDAVLNLLDQLAGQLGQVGTQVWATELPFLSSLSLAQAANLEQAFQTEVTSQIGAWSDTLQRTVANFSTAQDLAGLLAQVLDVSPSKIGVHFDPTTNSLTYNLSFTSYTFSGLLNQVLQTDLNHGGLASASISGQLSLVPKITASFTLGVNLTPLGRGFVLASSMPLSALNGGAGVRVNGTTPDLQITTSDGKSFTVSLGGAATVGDVIKKIQTASGGRVSVVIDPTSQQALDLIEQTPPPGQGATASPTFTVAALNGSYAAADLGIIGSDVLGLGTITGQSLSGDTLKQHFFIENATIQASITGTASQVAGQADLGAVALQMVNGTGSILVQGSLTLANATSFDALAKAIRSTTALGQLVSPTVSGTAQFKLPLKLAVPMAGLSLPSGATVAVNWTDITDPSTLSVAVTPSLDFSNLTIAPVLQGIQDAVTFVQAAGASLLSQQLPGLGTSVASAIDAAAPIVAALGSLIHAAPVTIDQLVGELSTALGQPVTLSYANNVLQLNLNYSVSASKDVDLNFNLSPSLGSIIDVNGAAALSLAGSGLIKLGLVVDLSQPTSPKFYLQDSSKISVGAMVEASKDVSFNATVGPLGLSIENGTVRLDDGNASNPQPATWSVSMNASSANHLWSITDAASEITSAVHGQLKIDLPTFFPTPDQPLDPSTPDLELIVGDLSKPGSTTQLIVPNVASAVSGVNLNGIMDQVVNGWDGLMRMLQSALTQQINATNIPVVGKQLQQALAFLQSMDQKVTALLDNAPQLAAQTVQQALYDALGPKGLNWLVQLTTTGATPADNYVQLQQSSTNIHYLIKLHESLVAVSTPVAVNLGLSGLGLSINGNAGLQAGFDATLGFGLILQAGSNVGQSGFYVDSTDTASVGFSAQLPTSATASLGFLQFNLTNSTPTTPPLSGSLSLGLHDVHGTGRLMLNDLTSTSSFSLGLNASAALNLHLDATLGGNTNLPHISTDFYFDWSVNPTAANPDKLGFSNVTFDMGGFIDNLLNQIDQVFKPIEPLAEVLSAPLPVLSQLAGHNVDLIDLASTLGLISPGTAEFVTEVLDIINGGLSVPGKIDLGSFTLDTSKAQDPSSQGNLNPSSTATNTPYSGSPVPGFSIPILSDPASAFQLLLGKDVPLVTYETPKLDLSLAFDEFFPIIGPLGADLAGEIGAEAQFGFGFDTSGFRAYAADDFRDPSSDPRRLLRERPAEPRRHGPRGAPGRALRQHRGLRGARPGDRPGRGRRRAVRLGQLHRARPERHRQGPPPGARGRHPERDHLRRLGRLAGLPRGLRQDRPGLRLARVGLPDRLGDPGQDRRAGTQHAAPAATGDARARRRPAPQRRALRLAAAVQQPGRRQDPGRWHRDADRDPGRRQAQQRQRDRLRRHAGIRQRHRDHRPGRGGLGHHHDRRRQQHRRQPGDRRRQQHVRRQERAQRHAHRRRRHR